MNVCVFYCFFVFRRVRKTNHLGLLTQRFLAYRQSLQCTKFCLPSFDNAITRRCLGCGKAGHRLESRRPGTSQIPGTILEGNTERKVTPNRKRGRHSPKRMSERRTARSVRTTALQDGRNFGRGCRKVLQIDGIWEVERVWLFVWTKEMLSLWVRVFGPLVENFASDVLSVYVQCHRRACLCSA